MAKVILFDDYIDAHTVKRQMVNNIDFRNMFGQRLLMALNGGFEYGIQQPTIKGGLYELPRNDGGTDFEPIPD
jgi:hypothetical protein